MPIEALCTYLNRCDDLERQNIILATVLSCMSSNCTPLAYSPILGYSSSVARGNRESLGQGPGWEDGIKILPQGFRNEWDRTREPISLQPPTILGERGWGYTLRRQNTGFRGVFKMQQKAHHLLTCVWGFSTSLVIPGCEEEVLNHIKQAPNQFYCHQLSSVSSLKWQADINECFPAAVLRASIPHVLSWSALCA